MGFTTKISDYEWERGDGPKDVPQGYDPEVKVKSKVVAADDKPEPEVSTVAKTKDVPQA